jgi:DNA-directed RNA polymerase subunit RPC12/RpoP
MICKNCGALIAKGTKLNTRKENQEEGNHEEDDSDEEMKVFRFHIRCPQCSSQIVYKTDPKGHRTFELVRGANRQHSNAPWLAADSTS